MDIDNGNENVDLSNDTDIFDPKSSCAMDVFLSRSGEVVNMDAEKYAIDKTIAVLSNIDIDNLIDDDSLNIYKYCVDRKSEDYFDISEECPDEVIDSDKREEIKERIAEKKKELNQLVEEIQDNVNDNADDNADDNSDKEKSDDERPDEEKSFEGVKEKYAYIKRKCEESKTNIFHANKHLEDVERVIDSLNDNRRAALVVRSRVLNYIVCKKIDVEKYIEETNNLIEEYESIRAKSDDIFYVGSIFETQMNELNQSDQFI
jgi:chromosome segregation ATPase